MFSTFAIWYLFLAGAGSGAFLCAAVVDMRSNDRGSTKEVALPAEVGFLSCVVLLAFASFLLFLDLGNPQAILLMFIDPLRSVMSAGAWLLLLGIGVSAGISALIILQARMPALLRGLEYAGMLLSAGIMAYTGVLLSSMVSIDFWNTPLLVALFIISALSSGCALVVLITFLYDGGTRRMPGLMRMSALFAGLEALTLIAFLASRWLYTPSAQQSCAMLFTGSLAGVFWGGLVTVGLLVPLAITIIRQFLTVPSLKLVDAGATLIGGFCLRYCVVLAAAYSAITITM